MADGDEDAIDQTESAADFVNRKLIQIARSLEGEQHLNFFRAMLFIRQRVDAQIFSRQTNATVLRRVLGRLPFSTRKQQLPPTESRDHPVDHALLARGRGDASEPLGSASHPATLARKPSDRRGVRYTSAGIVTKCLTPTTAAWVITNPRLSPMVASPRFVRAGEEVATGRMPSEETLEFLSRLADTMLEKSQGA